MTWTHDLAGAVTGGRPQTARLLAQRSPQVTVEGSLSVVFIVTLALIVAVGVATAGLAVYRYRNRRDPALRALVVGLVCITVAPLPFRVFIAGTVPSVLRDVVPIVFQTLGLCAILWAIYGDVDGGGDTVVGRPSVEDLVFGGVSVGIAAAAVAFGGLAEVGPVGVAAAVAGAFATFVAIQAARAAYRYRSPPMASLSLGIVCLAALPLPVSAVLFTAGTLPDAVVVGVVNGIVLVGETAMFATLAYR